MKIYFVACFAVLLLGCKSEIERIPEPENLIPRDTMVLVLSDLTVLEAHVTNKYPTVTVFKNLLKKSGDDLLKKYNISFKRLDESMNYYGSRQEEMQSIYTEIQDSLTLKLNRIQ